MKTIKVSGIVLAGLAAGVLAGILFAPAKGKKTRKRLLIKGKDYSDVLIEKSIKLLESVAVKFDKVLDEVFFDEKNTVQPEKEVLHESQII